MEPGGYPATTSGDVGSRITVPKKRLSDEMTMEAECVIVGGGIGGAVLALALGQRGHQIALLERDAAPQAIGRPEVLAQSTIQVFRQLGVDERSLQEAAVPLDRLELWHAERGQLFTLSQDEFRLAGAQPYSTDPGSTRQLLLERLATTSSVKVMRGVEVQELIREGLRIAGVQAVSEAGPLVVRAPLVIGDDGGRSRIRDGLGIPLATQDFPVDFLATAGPGMPWQSGTVGQAWIAPEAARDGIVGGVFMPLPRSRTAMALLLSPEAYKRFVSSPPSAFYDAAVRLSPRYADFIQSFRFPEELAYVRRPFGHVPLYVGDGAVLLGDAAHPVTPVGGQGANMSVADAMVLAEVAHDALASGDCSAFRLQAYEANRRPANTRSLQFSTRGAMVFRLLRACPWIAPMLLGLLIRIDWSPAVKVRLIKSVSQSFTSPALASGETLPVS
jgi:2-polyprenyl-6-methoxyphenol hydroxylase-like FAD-dependent oxidoreductase